MATEQYRRQVQLLVNCLDVVADEDCFALKGGTAINLFVRNLPRLSVDIDLAYLPLQDRSETLSGIRAALQRIAEQIPGEIPGAQVLQDPGRDGHLVRLQVYTPSARIKIETSPVLRGTVWEPKEQAVSGTVEEDFGFTSIKVVDFKDLYAGKIVAALDRQHPRDLFDVMLLLRKDGIDRQLIWTFLVYLISHNRPMSELLSPNFQDIADLYHREFVGMTEIETSLDDLLAARAELLSAIRAGLSKEDREFLLSVKSRAPKWELLGIEHVPNLPAVRWKLQNLSNMAPEKHEAALSKLRILLEELP